MTGTRLKLCSPSELRMRALTKEATKTKVSPKRTNRHRYASRELNPHFYHDRESISSTRSSPSRLFRSSSVSVVPIIGVSVVPIVFPRILVRGSNPNGCPKSRGKRQLYIYFKFSSGSLGHHHKNDRFHTPNKIYRIANRKN